MGREPTLPFIVSPVKRAEAVGQAAEEVFSLQQLLQRIQGVGVDRRGRCFRRGEGGGATARTPGGRTFIVHETSGTRPHGQIAGNASFRKVETM